MVKRTLKRNFMSRPLKSSFKKRSSRYRVKWSPDVKNIVRKSDKKLKRCSTNNSKLLLKIEDNKTQYECGKLYAQENDSIISLILKDKIKRVIGLLKLDRRHKKLLHLDFNGYTVKHNKPPLKKIKVKMELGDVIWLTNDKKIKRSAKCRGYDISWLGDVIKMHGSVSSSDAVVNKSLYRSKKRSQSRKRSKIKRSSRSSKNRTYKTKSKVFYSPRCVRRR